MAIPKIQSYPLPTVENYPKNKVSWALEPKKAALLIHDMQEYFVGFYGDKSPLMQAVIDNIVRLKAFAKANNIPVYYTAQPAEQDPADRALLNDMWGPGLTRFPESQPVVGPLAPEADDIVLTKWRYSAFHRSDLEAQLQQTGKNQLIICGIYAHIGVMISAADAFMRDIKPFLVGDAIADFSYDEHVMALSYVAGRCGQVTTTESVMTQAMKDPVLATYDAFKTHIVSLLDEADDEFGADDSLLDYGLDSVQVMQLINKWNKAGLQISFVELAKNPSVNGWWKLISDRLAA
jgi:bifunctional isochorismate lyase / aryl carrier protein